MLIFVYRFMLVALYDRLNIQVNWVNYRRVPLECSVAHLRILLFQNYTLARADAMGITPEMPYEHIHDHMLHDHQVLFNVRICLIICII